MKRLLFVLVLALGVVGFLAAQDSSSSADQMIQRFEDASQQIKLRILRTTQEQDTEGMGPLYRTALQYVLTNVSNIDSDGELQEIATLAVQGVVETDHTPAALDLWRLFQNFRDTQARVQLLEALAAVDADNKRILPSLHDWMAARHNLKKSGTTIDERVMVSALETLGDYSDPSSFNLILEAILVQYSSNVTNTAESTLFSVAGDPVQAASQAIRQRDPADKLPALDYLLASEGLSDDQKSQIALTALQNALSTDPVDQASRDALRQVRYTSAAWLRRTGYSEASSAMIRHFNQTFLDYDRGQIRKTWVLEAIAGLGAMGTEAAAERLTQFLDLLNTYTENDRAYDTPSCPRGNRQP